VETRLATRAPWLLLAVGGLLVVGALASIAFWTRTAYVALGLGAVCIGGALAFELASR
jgi:hypothetical protein